MTPHISLSARVLKRCETLGFTPPATVSLKDYTPQHGDKLQTFIEHNYHGSMGWMEETLNRRLHPKRLWPEARSAIIVGLNYGPNTNPLLTLGMPDVATISVYARNRDYHGLIKGRLKELAGLIAQDTKLDVKVFVDTAPLMEKPLAEASGLGWQGKHTNLVSKAYGSWLFLGTILTEAEFTPTGSEVDHCGSCQACLDICPTNAFPAPYQLDARRCISYLTIEHKGPVAPELRPLMGNRIYGCDDCLAVCPWNKFAVSGREAKLTAKDELNAPSLATLSQLNGAEFRAKFSGSPIKRIGRNQFIRNVLYAIGNSRFPELLPHAQVHLASDDTTVHDAAEWAVTQLKRT